MQNLILVAFMILGSTAHADLNSVANNYTLVDPMDWENITNWSEYSQSLLYAQSHLPVVEQIPEDESNRALLEELKIYYKTEIAFDSACRPFAWSAFPVVYVNMPLNFQEFDQYTDVDAFYAGYEKKMKSLGENLFSYYERLEIGVQDNLLPHGQIYEFLTQPSMPRFGMDMFLLSTLPQATCSYCASIDPKKLETLYDVHVAPYEFAIDQVIKGYPPYDPGFISSPVSIRKQCYDFVVKSIYSDITPQLILKKGNIELHRAELQMLYTALEMGYDLKPPESLAAFIKRVYNAMTAKTEFAIVDKQAYVNRFGELYRRVEAILPQITTKQVTIPLEYAIEVIEGDTGDYAGWTAGYNLDGDASKGTFSLYMFGGKNLKTFETASLFFHEGIPGHHLERASSFLMNQTLTKFEKENFYSPYIEGWGLYTEELALELGLYVTPEEMFAFWDLQRLRSLRMNVSYMYFYENWTQAQGEAFFEEHTFGDSKQAKIDAERPRDWSGQGLGYMIGKSVILGLRDSYVKDIGVCYSLPEFNDFILDQGGTYLDTLVREYSLWIVKHKCAIPNLDPKVIEKQARARILKRF